MSRPSPVPVLPSSLVAVLTAALLGLACAGAPSTAPAPPPAMKKAAPAKAMSPEAGGGFQLGPCNQDGYPEDARCGIYEVYEDREAGSGKKIGLWVVVVPATGQSSKESAVTYFAGGPGQASSETIGFVPDLLGDLRETRDILLVNMRGTALSNELRCPYQDNREGFMAGFLPLEGVKECWKASQPKGNLALYNTPIAVDDVEEVREALGYRQLDIMGGSYGTHMALVYARRHPQSVRTLYLSGPSPVGTRYPLRVARDAQDALDGWFEECRADTECSGAFPDLEGDLARVLARLDEGPVDVEVLDARTGEPAPFQLDRPVVAQTIRYMLYNSADSLRVPAFVHAAAEGNFEPLGELASAYGGIVDSTPDGFYLSVTCAEGVPFFTMEEAEKEAEGTFLGVYRAKAQKDACAAWPVPPLDRSFLEPVRTDIPTLIEVGERDPVTPAANGVQLHRQLSRSALLVVPDGAHSFRGLENRECTQELARQLVATGSVEGLDVESCRNAIRRPPFDLTVPERPEIVAVPREDLLRLEGTYGPEGSEFAAKIFVDDEGKLRAEFPGNPTFYLAALSAERFSIAGAPMGFELIFVLEGDGPATAVLFDQGGSGEPQRWGRR